MASLRMNSKHRWLSPHCVFLCLCLLQTAKAVTTAPAADPLRGVESLITELSSLSTLSAFRLFLQRAQTLITGLVYVSILVLPRNPITAANGDADNTINNKRKGGVGGNSSTSTTSSKAKNGGGNTVFPKSSTSSRKNNNTGGNWSGGGTTGAVKETLEMVSLGTTADGSDLEAWQRVHSALEHETACGLDWSNSCIYELKSGLPQYLLGRENNNFSSCDFEAQGVLVLAPEAEYPLPATAAFHAATNSVEGIICNEYDVLKGPHYADWQRLATVHNAQSFASLPMYISTTPSTATSTASDSTAACGGGAAAAPNNDNTTNNNNKILVGVLTLASKDPHAFESSRLVWLLAMALAPLAAQLKYAEPAVRLENFIARTMPLLLKENYQRTTGRKKENSGGNSTTTSATTSNPSENNDFYSIPRQNGKKQPELMKDKEMKIFMNNLRNIRNGMFDSDGLFTDVSFALNLVSLVILYWAFSHAQRVAEYSTATASITEGTGSSSSSSHFKTLAAVMKALVAAEILFSAFFWIWFTVVAAMQRPELPSSLSSPSSSVFESPSKREVTRPMLIFTTSILGLIFFINSLMFLPLAHTWLAWFVFNNVLGGAFYPSGKILICTSALYFWQVKKVLQPLLNAPLSAWSSYHSSYRSSCSSSSASAKFWGQTFIAKFYQENKLYFESIFLAAASAEHVCSGIFGLNVTRYECSVIASGIQFALRQMVPAAMLFVVVLFRWAISRKKEKRS